MDELINDLQRRVDMLLHHTLQPAEDLKLELEAKENELSELEKSQLFEVQGIKAEKQEILEEKQEILEENQKILTENETLILQVVAQKQQIQSLRLENEAFHASQQEGIAAYERLLSELRSYMMENSRLAREFKESQKLVKFAQEYIEKHCPMPD